MKLEIDIHPTPNPNALKFVLNFTVKNDGKSTYRSPSESMHNPLACALFTIRGVDQLHFYQNTITITKFSYEDWELIEPQVRTCLEDRVGAHNPEYNDPDPEKERRSGLPEDLLKIEEILDREIRPGLQGDGGDLAALSYKDHVLLIRYQGACGTCPSSTTGTLEAIKAILRDKLDPELEVYIAPEF